MTLCSDFKGLKRSTLHLSPLYFIHLVVNELLTEEIRLQSYSKKKILYTFNLSMLAVPSKPFSNN